MVKCTGQFLAVFLFLIIPVSVIAQNQQDMMNAFPPSPEAAALGKYGEIESNLYEGKANITVPIYNYTIPGFSLPISLDYTTSAIRVDQIATNVGLGWTLNAGGIITQTVNGLYDLNYDRLTIPPDPRDYDPTYDAGNIGPYDDAKDIVGGLLDTETDIFLYNFPGKSGKFVFNNAGTEIHTIPYDVLQISESNNTFDILDDDGTKFDFDIQMAVFYKDSCLGGGGSGGRLGSLTSRFPFTGISNLLSKITTVDGNVIDLEYETYFHEYESIIDQKYYKPAGQSGCPSTASLDRICYRKNQAAENRLSKISSPNSDVEVHFKYTDVRQDISDAGADAPRELDEIIILVNSDTLKVYQLSHSYFTSSGGASSELNKRLRLDSVNEVGLPGWSFTYNTSTMPPRDSFAVDHWGHYNGKTSNSMFIPKHTTYLPGGADRNPDVTKMYTGILEKVTYPTGGFAELDYETTSNNSQVRIKKITTKETSSSTAIIKEFEYVSGFAPSTPDYIDDFDIEIELLASPPHTEVCTYKLLTSSPILPIGGVSNSVGHGEVIEKLGASGVYGQTKYVFSTGTSSFSDSSVVNRVASEPAYSWTGGKLLEQEAQEHVSGSTFKKDQETLNSYKVYHDPNTSYNYAEQYPNHNETFIFDLRVKQLSKEKLLWTASSAIYIPATFEVEIYRNISAWYHPKTTKVRIYDDAGTNYMESLTEFKYGEPSHIQLTQRTETNSLTSEEKITSYKYASEINGTIESYNMLSQIYSETVSDGSVDLRKSWTEWSNLIAGKIGVYKPYKTWIWNGSGSSAPSNPSISNSILTSKVWAYHDSTGNIVKVQTGDGSLATYTEFFYGSDTNPLSQAGHNGKKGVYLTGIQKELDGLDSTPCSINDLCTKAYYDTKGRLIKLEDETNNDIEFTYDALNRLKTTINQNQETVSTINYFNNTNYSSSNPHYIETLTHYDPNNSLNVTKSINYFDGLGREIQTQARGGNTVIATETLYDERGLPEVAARPLETTATAFPGYYTQGLLSGGTTFTPSSTGTAIPSSAPVHSYYAPIVATANDEDFAYSQTQYEASPLARVEKSTLPGTSHQMGSGKEVTTTYGLNTSETFATSAQGSTPAKTWAVNTLNKTVTEDPDGKKTITYTNGWGQTIASGVDMSGDSQLTRASTDLVTEFAYDTRGNLVRVEDPRGLATTYTYNTLGQLESKKLPDQTLSHQYRYDNKGRLRFHRDPNLDAGSDHYYYTKYDDLDRPTEVGIRTSSADFDDETDINNQSFPTSSNTAYLKYYYDGASPLSGHTPNNTKGRLTRAQHKDPNSIYWGSTFYSYNELGLVEWVIQQPAQPTSSNNRKIEYSYDELGRMTRLYFNPLSGSADDHYFWYYYDELGRLEKVTSYGSNAESSALTEAEYTYYADGQVKQLKLGGGAQTLDYEYTVQGWMEELNNGDATGGDVFGMFLDYSDNGNIIQQQWEQAAFSTSTYNYFYDYDTANRLKEACYGTATCTSTGDFDVSYTYDKNGNISYIGRNASGSDPDIEYYVSFIAGTNKVDDVLVDGVSSATETYSHDASGNVTENGVQGITSASYDWRNLPTTMIANGSTLRYAYDADGNRVKKELAGSSTTWYVRGADGQTVAAYNGSTLLYINILANGQIIGQIDN